MVWSESTAKLRLFLWPSAELCSGARANAPHSRRLRLGIQASLALLRRMEASRVGCDGQLVDLRFVPCEVRPENAFHFYDEWRLVGEDAFLYHNRDTLSALSVHVVIGWARAHPISSRTRS